MNGVLQKPSRAPFFCCYCTRPFDYREDVVGHVLSHYKDELIVKWREPEKPAPVARPPPSSARPPAVKGAPRQSQQQQKTITSVPSQLNGTGPRVHQRNPSSSSSSSGVKRVKKEDAEGVEHAKVGENESSCEKACTSMYRLQPVRYVSSIGASSKEVLLSFFPCIPIIKIFIFPNFSTLL